MARLNTVCKSALAAAGTSEIKFKNIDDCRKRKAAERALEALLDCSDCRAMVLTWNLLDRRHQVLRRDDDANFHRMLFHGLRSVADWFGDVTWQWYHDMMPMLRDEEVAEFLNNTRGHKKLAGFAENLFGEKRPNIRIVKTEQRCSKEVPIIGLADFLAGAVRHSIVDGPGCIQAYRTRGGQEAMDFGDNSESEETRAIRAKRAMVIHVREQSQKRSLGVSLESTAMLATHRKGSKLWFWHYEPQGDYDQAPTKLPVKA